MDTREDDSTSASSSSSTEEEYLMVTNRSRRERKEIKYNFDEFDDLIKSAIKSEDAVTEYKRKHKHNFDVTTLLSFLIFKRFMLGTYMYICIPKLRSVC